MRIAIPKIVHNGTVYNLHHPLVLNFTKGQHGWTVQSDSPHIMGLWSDPKTAFLNWMLDFQYNWKTLACFVNDKLSAEDRVLKADLLNLVKSVSSADQPIQMARAA
jgi:hypothetical protein